MLSPNINNLEKDKFTENSQGETSVRVVSELLDPSGAGSGKFSDFQGQSTPGSEQSILSETVPAGKKWKLSQVRVVSRAEGVFKILADSQVIGSGRTGAAAPNGFFNWLPMRIVNAGEVVSVKYVARAGSPAQDIEAYLQALELSA